MLAASHSLIVLKAKLTSEYPAVIAISLGGPQGEHYNPRWRRCLPHDPTLSGMPIGAHALGEVVPADGNGPPSRSSVMFTRPPLASSLGLTPPIPIPMWIHVIVHRFAGLPGAVPLPTLDRFNQ